ncbi:unnamed protein product, partial [Phaeothamnion confervicola]
VVAAAAVADAEAPALRSAEDATRAATAAADTAAIDAAAAAKAAAAAAKAVPLRYLPESHPAAVRIQTWWRCRIAVKRCQQQRALRVWAATKIQSLFRMRRGRRVYRKQRRVAEIRQRVREDKEAELMAVEDARSRAHRKDQSALRTIERAIFGYLGRQKALQKRRERQLAKAQARVQEKLAALERYQREQALLAVRRLEKDRWAAKLQAFWRGVLARRRCARIMAERCRGTAVTRIQLMCRYRSARLDAAARRREAARVR